MAVHIPAGTLSLYFSARLADVRFQLFNNPNKVGGNLQQLNVKNEDM
jgi:hypothetical protein